ncbi:MAG: FTR1 family protein [Chitinophagales bacterium]|nr:FTR1 family protein [Chitinophagales bacterium]
MYKRAHFFLFVTISFYIFSIQSLFADDSKTAAETVVHLLSYVSMDYAGAVESGKILDQQEYEEQQEFSLQALHLVEESPSMSEDSKSKLLGDIQKLIELINTKAPAEKISTLANQINNSVIIETGLQTSPKTWPSLSNGRKLFSIHCASCHGEKGNGDGVAGKDIEPKPSNFHNADLMKGISAYQAYNSIRLGVPGTAMQGHAHLSEQDIWDLAFYVKSILYQDPLQDNQDLISQFNSASKELNLEDLSFLSDNEILHRLSGTNPKNKEQKLLALRTYEPEKKPTENSLPTAKNGLLSALESYKKGDKKIAKIQAINAYLDGVEPVEARLQTVKSDFVPQLEAQMFKVRQTIEKDLGVEALQNEVDQAINLLDEANHLLGGQNLNYWLAYILALSIMLREALEAFLIIAIAITLIRSTKIKGALKWLHAGWISAVLMGGAGWFLADYIIQFGGKNRELLEGLVSIFAVVILIFAGFWLHDKTYASKWTKFINEKIGGYLKKESMYGLAFFSFMVVFREAFEVILFLQAIQLDAGVENVSAIGLGALTAVFLIAIIAYIFFKYTKKMPLQYIFKYSSWMILILSVILIGKGVHSLQEAGWISHHSISFIRIDWLGIYPNMQTLLSQLILITFIAVMFWISDKRNLQVKG